MVTKAILERRVVRVPAFARMLALGARNLLRSLARKLLRRADQHQPLYTHGKDLEASWFVGPVRTAELPWPLAHLHGANYSSI